MEFYVLSETILILSIHEKFKIPLARTYRSENQIRVG